MAGRARIEELSDSDPEEMDPSDFDPPTSNSARNRSIINPSSIPSTSSGQREALRPQIQRQGDPNSEAYKSWQRLYPVYFDSTRSRAEGRRVAKNLATPNPLARDIVDAVAEAGIRVTFDPGKTHPKDWANPGCVKCHLEGQRNIKNKHHLYAVVATWLKAHPTTEKSPMRLPVSGLPAPKNGVPPAPEIPKGWRMGTVLPLHSPAVTGGGVSENLFKDMMAEMQGEASGGGAGSGEAKKKKEKKKGR